MIRFRARGVEFRLHALVILTILLALALGVTVELIALLIALCAHELAHLVAARIWGLEIDYVEIMPFGGAAHIAHLYDAPIGPTVAVALAGPLANLFLALLGAALGWWGALSFPDAARMVRVNIILMLFNLLPALPLDGGRVLCALAGPRLGRRRALLLSVGLAHALAGLLVAVAVIGFFETGMLNLSFLIMGVFLVATSLMEKGAALASDMAGAVENLTGRKRLPARVRLVALDKAASPALAAKYMRRGEVTLFALYENGALVGFEDECAVAKRAIR